MHSYVILIIMTVLIIAVMLRAGRRVPKDTVFIIERLGRYSHSAPQGFIVLAPFIDKVAYKCGLKPRQLNLPPVETITADNDRLWIEAALTLRITDPLKACYDVNNYPQASAEAAGKALTGMCNTAETKQIMENRRTLELDVMRAAAPVCLAWGIEIINYTITNIKEC